MANSTDFESFLKDINPSKSTIDEASRLHQSLRNHLKTCKSYKQIYIHSYLSGSYAKQTFIRPKKNSDSCDIDIVVEINRTTDDSPAFVLDELERALKLRSCYQNSTIQNHSVGIDMANFHLDVVPLVKDENGFLNIGSSKENIWKRTEPKKHISWTTDVNQGYENAYKPLVKIIKWWRRENCPSDVKYPKGITLEKMIADNLLEPNLTIEERVMQTMANLSEAYSEDLKSGTIPFIEDPAFCENNLAEKYKLNDFVEFTNKLAEHLDLLAEKGTGNDIWKTILGNVFPAGNESKSCSNDAMRIAQERAMSVNHRQKLGYPLQSKKPNATITATVTLPSGEQINLPNDGLAVPKGSSVIYKVTYSPVKDGRIRWQITNTGEEAMRCCQRGGFEAPNEGKTSRREETAYTGKHFVQCFVVRRGYCVRWTRPFFINVE